MRQNAAFTTSDGTTLPGGGFHMNSEKFIVGVIAAACVIANCSAAAEHGQRSDGQCQDLHAGLESQGGNVGAPRIEGKDPIAGKDAPALYFGTTKMNNLFGLVDEVVNENGGTATLFVKAGDEYVRVATNVKKDDGSRAIGTILDPTGAAIGMIKKGEAFYGEANILGKPYITGYEPIKDASGNVIGTYYVGYLK